MSTLFLNLYTTEAKPWERLTNAGRARHRSGRQLIALDQAICAERMPAFGGWIHRRVALHDGDGFVDLTGKPGLPTGELIDAGPFPGEDLLPAEFEAVAAHR